MVYFLLSWFLGSYCVSIKTQNIRNVLNSWTRTSWSTVSSPLPNPEEAVSRVCMMKLRRHNALHSSQIEKVFVDEACIAMFEGDRSPFGT